MSNIEPDHPVQASSNDHTATVFSNEADPAVCGSSCDDSLFPIRAVSSITGVNPITLRAWERRYNLIRPTRTATGHRLYSAVDIQKIQRIVALSAQGIGFSQIAQILTRESRPNKSEPAPTDQSPPFTIEPHSEHQTAPSAQGKSLVESLKEAVIHMNPLALRRIEQQAMMWLPPEQVLRSILIEAYRQLEQRDAWPDRDLGLHWFGHHVRQRLEWWLLQKAQKPSRSHRLILVDTPTEYRPLYANECLLIMALAEKNTVQLMTATLAEPQRTRLVNRWQAQHWIRLLEPSEHETEHPGGLLSGSTQLHWCQITSDKHALSITPDGICRGSLNQCQRYLLEQMS